MRCNKKLQFENPGGVNNKLIKLYDPHNQMLKVLKLKPVYQYALCESSHYKKIDELVYIEDGGKGNTAIMNSKGNDKFQIVDIPIKFLKPFRAFSLFFEYGKN